MREVFTADILRRAIAKLDAAPCTSDMALMPDGTIVTITPTQRRAAHADWLNRQIVKRLAERKIAEMRAE